MRSRARRLGQGTVLLLVAWLALPALPAAAITFTVTKTTDTNDGTCDADCGLREAIIAANALGGADTIEIPAGHYKLTITGSDDTSAAGDLDIASELTIKTIGGMATVDADGIDRVIDVLASGDATISGLTITGGSTSGEGGGIRNTGSLTLANSIVRGNVATLNSGGIENSGTATLTGIIVTGNIADLVGGINNSGTGTMTISSSIVSKNETVTGHSGGIRNAGTMTTITHTTVSENVSASYGGGVLSTGGTTTTITNSAVTGNEAAAIGGGGLYNVGDSTTTITNSTVSGNETVGDGGGVFNTGAITVTTITSTTVSGNQATGNGGGVSSVTGGSGSATLEDATITANRADSDDNSAGDGGGVFNSGGTLSIGNTILAGNTDGPTTTHPDCSGSITSTDFNIIGSTAGCTVTPMGNDTTGSVPAMGPLAWNGGPTETHALPAGSAAIDHGPTSGVATDQRGVPRPQGASLDTGAYEYAECSGLVVNVVGTSAKDNLTGTAQADGVLALGGADIVHTDDGNDKQCGGTGNDKLYGEGGNDKLLGQAGNDLLDGGPGNDTCIGGSGSDKLKSC